MKMDPQSLMLFTVVKNLHKLGYMFKVKFSRVDVLAVHLFFLLFVSFISTHCHDVLQIYAIEDGVTRPMWETISNYISILTPEQYGHIDWSMYDTLFRI